MKTKKIPVSSLRYPLPGSVSEEEEVLEMRVSQEHRIWGFQNQSTFYVIWFDPTHAVCPA
ncbi:MAG6450 family protein [Bacillus thuringiensis]|uniref:MAG6450 family protein n=1 Tax=Bacillus thuringiensis TaxID=1428 RepID=UPI003BF6E20B